MVNPSSTPPDVVSLTSHIAKVLIVFGLEAHTIYMTWARAVRQSTSSLHRVAINGSQFDVIVARDNAHKITRIILLSPHMKQL